MSDYITILRVRVVEQVLNIEVLHNIIDRTQNVYKIIFEFDNEWTGYAKTVLFRNNKDVRFSILDNTNECLIPSDMVVNDNLYIAIQGNRDGQILTTKKADYVKVMESGGHIELMTDVFTQSEYDKLMDELANVRIIAEQAILDAQQVSVDTQQVAIDKGEISYWKDEVERNTNTVTTKTTEALNAASRATSQAAISQNLFDQLQPMNADVSSKAPSIVSEAAGSIITLDDSSNMPLQSLTIYGKSTQDGTPTPEAPVEIVSVENPELGVVGSNLLDLESSGVKTAGCVKLGDGRVKCAINDGYYASLYIYDADFFKLLCFHDKKICFSVNDIPEDRRVSIIIFGKHREKDDDYTQEVSGKTGNKKVCVMVDNGFTNISRVELRFNRHIELFTDTETIFSDFYLGLLDLPYTPYIPEQSLTFPYALRGIPVASGGNYTDESGQQWICDTVEVNADGSGKLVQRVKYESIADYIDRHSWSFFSGSSDKIFSNNDTTMANSFGDAVAYGLMTDTFLISSFNVLRDGSVASPAISFRISTARGICIRLLSNKSTIEEFIAEVKALGGNIQYILATPIETDLTAEEVQAFQALHTNKPYSTIFNSAGAGQKVEYVADTKLYIDKKFQELTGGETNV